VRETAGNVFTEKQTAKQLIESELARRIVSTFSFFKRLRGTFSFRMAV